MVDRILFYALCSSLLLISGCTGNSHTNHAEYDFMKRIAFSCPAEGETTLAVIPFLHNKDTIYCCSSISSLYYELNIKVISYEQFSELLYRSYKLNAPLSISDEYYHQLYDWGDVVLFDETVDSIYRQHGVEGLLKYFETLDTHLLLINNNKQSINYLAYLLWENECVIADDAESGTWHIYHKR